MLNLPSSLLKFDMFVSTPIGKSFLATRVLKDDLIFIRDGELPVNLILLNLKEFDTILGRDWLAAYHALVDCFNKKVTFRILGQLEFCFERGSIDIPVQLISVMKAQSLLRKWCHGYLAYAMDNDNEAKLDETPIVQDYDVFPEDLPRLPPKREVEFIIELVPGTTPISKAPYHMVLLKLKELKS